MYFKFLSWVRALLSTQLGDSIYIVFRGYNSQKRWCLLELAPRPETCFSQAFAPSALLHLRLQYFPCDQSDASSYCSSVVTCHSAADSSSTLSLFVSQDTIFFLLLSFAGFCSLFWSLSSHTPSMLVLSLFSSQNSLVIPPNCIALKTNQLITSRLAHISSLVSSLIYLIVYLNRGSWISFSKSSSSFFMLNRILLKCSVSW